MSSTPLPFGLALTGAVEPGFEAILTPEALAFLADLHRTFSGRVHTLLQYRKDAQKRFDDGRRPIFPRKTEALRAADWNCAPLPADLLDRRVEITGPADRKMIINALNSGASVFMADLEDSMSPTWTNVVEGQINLRDAVRRTIRLVDEARGKTYALAERTAVLMVRPRGWHLFEAHLTVDGAPIPGALFGFGLYFFHNAHELIARGTGPYFYLPKMQSFLEARLWNDVFVHAQRRLGIPNGTIKATPLIETLPASFQLDEILFEIKDHAAGLNCGRWDYIFSFIKTFRAHASFLLPDRGQVGMTQHFMRSYTERLIQVCHRRGVLAMGGMAAQIPIKDDPEANEAALAKVRADKLREVKAGHDGTWVAHPGLVPEARAIFDAHMKGPNQLANKREDVSVTPLDLIRVPEGTRTEAGLRTNIRVGIQYLEAWLRGSGCVPLYNLMEDAATAEISRSQIWQQVHHGATLEDGSTVTADRVATLVDEEMTALREALGAARYDAGRFDQARALFFEVATSGDFVDFLTLPAYEQL